MLNKETKETRGYGFVYFEDSDQVRKLLEGAKDNKKKMIIDEREVLFAMANR